jgi:hypothetical protein
LLLLVIMTWDCHQQHRLGNDFRICACLFHLLQIMMMYDLHQCSVYMYSPVHLQLGFTPYLIFNLSLYYHLLCCQNYSEPIVYFLFRQTASRSIGETTNVVPVTDLFFPFFQFLVWLYESRIFTKTPDAHFPILPGSIQYFYWSTSLFCKWSTCGWLPGRISQA